MSITVATKPLGSKTAGSTDSRLLSTEQTAGSRSAILGLGFAPTTKIDTSPTLQNTEQTYLGDEGYLSMDDRKQAFLRGLCLAQGFGGKAFWEANKVNQLGSLMGLSLEVIVNLVEALQEEGLKIPIHRPRP